MSQIPNAERDAQKVNEALDHTTGDHRAVQNIVQQQLTDAQKTYGNNEQGFRNYQQDYASSLQKSGALPELSIDWSSHTGSRFTRDGNFAAVEIDNIIARNDKTPYETLMVTGLKKNYNNLKQTHEDGGRYFGLFGFKPDLDMITKDDMSTYLKHADYYRDQDHESQRLENIMKPLLDGTPSLFHVLDGATDGKYDGTISKQDLEIYKRMNTVDCPQVDAVDTILKAWDNPKDPNFAAVQQIRGYQARTSIEAYDGNPAGDIKLRDLVLMTGQDPSEIKSAEDLNASMTTIRKRSGAVIAGSAEEIGEGGSSQSIVPRADKPAADAHQVTIEEASKFGKVEVGEGYYQVAQRLLEMTGEKANHEQIRTLSRAIKTANNGHDVLSTKDNLAALLSSHVPGNDDQTLLDLIPKKKTA
ncbi:hypothetical protein BH11CYA1_BH11CYA1_00200 [soil metagenome]